LSTDPRPTSFIRRETLRTTSAFKQVAEQDCYGARILSVPYTMERLAPQLSAAVDGNPSTKVPVNRWEKPGASFQYFHVFSSTRVSKTRNTPRASK